MMYAYIDGDDIGLKIEKSFMNNDEVSLQKINNDVKDAVNSISNQLIVNGFDIIFSGADGIICKKQNIGARDLFELIRKYSNDINFSMGVGPSLCDVFLALRYAKSNGKNTAALYNGDFSIIN
ncbi:mCpol domain-containing protein [Paenibacillus sp. LMG 31460]|uniref:MCpol domain-containing protein n=1 Tax=Paenibacillus germinis TaxID=2654979 RepID=A0ABX1YTH9_9BACL|nr:mCpol domain-containing protein [Paenibacillus germinis]NOU84247.1 mCpol domain-containing protein [Paenibacillus germinis]